MTEQIGVVFDTETTGLIKPGASIIEKQPYITELYALKFIHRSDGVIEKVDEFESLFNIPIPVSAEITRITGISDFDLKDQPTFREKFNTLAEFFTGVDRMVAHNLAFDRSMLANEMVRIDKVLKFPWPRIHVCTIEKSLHYEQRRMNLARLHEHLFSKGFEGWHRAKADVIPLFECYKEMVKLGDIL